MATPRRSNAQCMEADYETLMQRMQLNDNNVKSNNVTNNSCFQKPPGANDHFSRQQQQQQQQIHAQQQQQQQQLATGEYRTYERNNIIAASKFATPRMIEQLPLNAHSPVYENLEFYGNTNNTTGAAVQFDSKHKRAQPQSPTSPTGGNNSTRSHYLIMQAKTPANNVGAAAAARYTHTPVPTEQDEATPIYENLKPHSGQRAQPQASPATASIYQHIELPPGSELLASPLHRRSTSNTAKSMGGGGGSINSSAASLTSPTQRYRNLSLPSHLNSSSNSPVKMTNNDYKLMQHTPVKGMKTNAQQQQQQQLQQQQHIPGHHHPLSINVSVNPNYIACTIVTILTTNAVLHLQINS